MIRTLWKNDILGLSSGSGLVLGSYQWLPSPDRAYLVWRSRPQDKNMREKYAVNSLDWKYCTCCSTLPQLFMSKNSLSPNLSKVLLRIPSRCSPTSLPQISPQTPEKTKGRIYRSSENVWARGAPRTPTRENVMKKTLVSLTCHMDCGHGTPRPLTPTLHFRM